MKMLSLFLFISLSAQGLSRINCHAFWEARNSGKNWAYRVNLDDVNMSCASKLIIAKSPKGDCGVFVPVSYEIEEYIYADEKWKKSSHLSQDIDWFPCKNGEVEYSVGDIIENSKLITQCETISTRALYGQVCRGKIVLEEFSR